MAGALVITGQQPIGAGGNSAQRYLLESLMLGQSRGLVGLLDRRALIHNDTSVLVNCA